MIVLTEVFHGCSDGKCQDDHLGLLAGALDPGDLTMCGPIERGCKIRNNRSESAGINSD